MFLILKEFKILTYYEYILYWLIIIYYYTDMLRYLLIYQDIDSNDENADIMSEEDADNISNNNIIET